MVCDEVGMTNNWVDLPVPAALPDLYSRFEALEWAKKNCVSYITNDAVQVRGEYHYRFYFGKEQDRVAFILRWL